MKCPVCKNKDLVMSEWSGIEEIDYCPECRGVWLDRGELDKIIERNMTSQQEAYREPAPQKEYREEKYYKKVKDMFNQPFVSEFFNQENINNLLTEHYKNIKNHGRKIYNIYVFLIWYDVYFNKNWNSCIDII